MAMRKEGSRQPVRGSPTLPARLRRGSVPAWSNYDAERFRAHAITRITRRMVMAGTMLDRQAKDRLIDALIAVPGTDGRHGRTALMQGIPNNVRAALNRNDNQFVDLMNIVEQLERLAGWKTVNGRW